MFSVLLLSATMLMCYPGESWFGTLLNALLIHGIVVCLLISIVALIKRYWWIAATSVVCSGMGMYELPSYTPHNVADISPASHQLKVAHFNVWVLNNNYQAMTDKVLQLQPDVVSFQEVTFTWAYKLSKGLKSDYPYQYPLPRHGTTGMAVFSKHPIENAEWVQLQGLPNFTGKIAVGSEKVAIIASHANNPVFPHVQLKRNQHLHKIGEFLRAYNGPYIAIGDYNTVPWDKTLRDMCKKSDLHDSRNSLSPTYTAGLPFGQVPIDYILYNGQLNCHSFTVLEDVGSDHLGIMGVYSVKEKLGSTRQN